MLYSLFGMLCIFVGALWCCQIKMYLCEQYFNMMTLYFTFTECYARYASQYNHGCGSGCKIINIANPCPPLPASSQVPPPTFYKVHSWPAPGSHSGQCEDKKSINIKLLPTFIIFFFLPLAIQSSLITGSRKNIFYF